jgi:acyl carrier protein
MDNVEDRLARCFATLFPDLNQPEIRRASIDSVAGWDSVATVTLINLVEEEFGVQVGLEDVEELLSFEEFRAYLEERVQV